MKLLNVLVVISTILQFSCTDQIDTKKAAEESNFSDREVTQKNGLVFEDDGLTLYYYQDGKKDGVMVKPPFMSYRKEHDSKIGKIKREGLVLFYKNAEDGFYRYGDWKEY